MILACITHNGTDPLEVLSSGIMTGSRYKQVLADHVVPYKGLFKWFQQDNASSHKIQEVLEYMNDEEIEILHWPPYSPDLNCIENIWAYLKMKVRARNPTSVEEMTEVVTDIWYNDVRLKRLCNSVLNSMPSRIRAVVVVAAISGTDSQEEK